jgi:drug/metabolite transporter (DMT)-like permease
MPPPLAAGAPFPLAGEAAALASSLTWAGAVLVYRRMRGRVDAAAVGLVKNATAALAFTVAILLVWRTPWPTEMPGGAQALFIASGVAGLAICDTFLIRSLMEIGPRRATLLMLLAPVFVFFGALAPPLRESAVLGDARRLVGVALALAGVAMAASESPDVDADPARWRRGVLDGLLASLFQAAGILLSRCGFLAATGSPRNAPLAIVAGASQVRLVAGTIGLAVAGLALGKWPGWSRSLREPGTLRPIALTALYGTFLGIGFFQCGQAWAGSVGIATTLSQLTPVWIIPLSTIFLHETHGRRAWLSTLVALAGVALMTL